METQLIAWFTAHPFIRTQVAVGVGAGIVAVKADYSRYKEHSTADATLVFQWRIAVRQYAIAALIAMGPGFSAEILKILGGGM